MNTMTFYTNPQSRGAVVRWLLTELDLEEGIDYTTVNLQYGSSDAGGIKSPDYLVINPMGKVPALVVHGEGGDVMITEVPAICAYLADAYPETNLAPSVDSPLRGAYYRWLFYTHGVLEPAVLGKAMNFFIPAQKSANSGYGTYDDVINTLKTTLADTTYLCGNSFTTADLFLAAYVGWYMQWDMLPKLPEFEAYVATHTARKAYQQSQPDA